MLPICMTKNPITEKFYSAKEELLNVWSHAAGSVMALVVGVILIVYAALQSDALVVWGVSLYLFGMLSSYVASTTYHALPAGSKYKAHLRKWDHAAIYWHIAGSYSPLTLAVMWQQGVWGLVLFIFVWTCAIVGTVLSFVAVKGKKSKIETVCYVVMGLCILVAFKPLLDSAGTVAVSWIIAEGVCYITGALFYSLKKNYMHSVFHFFVLAGSICHIIAVWEALLLYFE